MFNFCGILALWRLNHLFFQLTGRKQMIRKLFIISIAALVYLGVRDWQHKPITHPPGVLVVGAPVQVDVQPSSFEMNGYLVDVDHESGWRWRTSMSRTDTGAGACEIVYVESVRLSF